MPGGGVGTATALTGTATLTGTSGPGTASVPGTATTPLAGPSWWCCCQTTCWFFYDDFDDFVEGEASDMSDNWIEVAGDWGRLSGELVENYADAVGT